MTQFPRFGPNGAVAFFNNERDVPPGWKKTAEDARLLQTLAPPMLAMMADHIGEQIAEAQIVAPQRRHRRGRR